MAQKFSKYIFGGILGAALAMLFSPKKGSEMRRMLMSGKDSEPGGAPPAEPAAVAEPVAVAEPAVAEEPAGSTKADLEARLEETRRQVEALLDQTIIEPGNKPEVSAAEAAMTASAAPAADETGVVELEEPYAEEKDAVVEPEPETEEPALDDEGIEGPDMIVLEEPPAEVETSAGTSFDSAEADFGTPSSEASISPILEETEVTWEDDQWVAETIETDAAEAATQSEAVVDETTEAEEAPETETLAEAELEAHVEEAIAAAEAATVAETAAEEELEAPAETAVEPEASEEIDDASIGYLSTPAEGEPVAEVKPGGLKPEDLSARQAPPDKPAFDREAMRRRIEETRSRLKAKAFDAMVQGESFITTEKEENSEGAEVDLDVESQHAIEKTLREED